MHTSESTDNESDPVEHLSTERIDAILAEAREWTNEIAATETVEIYDDETKWRTQ